MACPGPFVPLRIFVFGLSFVFAFDFFEFVLHDCLKTFVSSGEEEYIVSFDSGPSSMSSECFEVGRDTFCITVRFLQLGKMT